MSGNPLTGIEVAANCPLWDFMWRIFPVIITIDGTPYQKKWGVHFFEATPGRHTVKVCFKTFIIAESGANYTEVTVEPSKVVRVNYEPPRTTALSPGKISVEQVTLLAPSAPLANHSAATQAVTGMVSAGANCGQCGNALVQGARYCSECGATAPQPKACPACGQQQPSGKFCANCGAKLSS